jgi:peptide/nickel transport system ATP-binding protein
MTQTAAAPVLEGRGLARQWQRHGRSVGLAALDFSLLPGETLALVGESGSGKTTAARLILRLLDPDAGQVFWGGEEVTRLTGRALRQRRRRVQMVFQDPASAFNPRATVKRLLADGLSLAGRPATDAAVLLEEVGLPAVLLPRHPHELSGGQRQRVAIARALACRPEVLVLDEPVSALDVSVRAQVLNLLRRLQQQTGCACLFITHDLAVVQAVADRVMVMQEGRVVETAPTGQLLAAPQHDYTRSLIAAVPRFG